MTDISKYKNVSLKHVTYNKLKSLSGAIVPGTELSISKTVDKSKTIPEPRREIIRISLKLVFGIKNKTNKLNKRVEKIAVSSIKIKKYFKVLVKKRLTIYLLHQTQYLVYQLL